MITVVPTTSPQDAATRDLVKHLRGTVLPEALDGTGITAQVGGVTAALEDQSVYMVDRMPLFIAGVVGLSFLLLLIAFHAPLISLKAAVMNLLSVSAAYGVMTLVAKGGAVGGLIGIDHEVPIAPFMPVMMFAILFGLSMDYEVFLVSRIREEYLKDGDNTRAVAAGLAKTARVITAAAAIMVVVFLAFVASPEVFLKLFGIGLAVAIFLDATVVRMVLVPAVMQLLGNRNWWIPDWLERRLPRLDVENVEGRTSRSVPREGDQAACLTLPIAPSSRSRPAATSRRSERLDHRLLGPLEEDVGDLDLGRAGRLADREGVDVALDPVAPVELQRLVAAEAVGLEVDDQRRPPGVLDQEVDRAAKDGAGDLEQDRDLGPRPRALDPLPEELRAEPGADRAQKAGGIRRLDPGGEGEALDDLRRRLAPSVRLAPLEQRVGGGAPGGPRLRPRRRLLLAGGVVRDRLQGRVALDGGDRRVGERPVRRLRRGRDRAAAPGRRRGPRRAPRPGSTRTSSATRSGEARLTRTAICDGSKPASRPSRGRGAGTGDGGVLDPVEVEGGGDPLDHRGPRFHLARRLLLDHAAEDQPLLGARRGDVEEAQLLLGLARLRLLPEVVVVVEVDSRRAQSPQPQPDPGARPPRGRSGTEAPSCGAGAARAGGSRRPRTRAPWRCGRS